MINHCRVVPFRYEKLIVAKIFIPIIDQRSKELKSVESSYKCAVLYVHACVLLIYKYICTKMNEKETKFENGDVQITNVKQCRLRYSRS